MKLATTTATALALALVSAAPALALTAPAAPAAQAAPRWTGLTVPEITERLTAAGMTVGEPRTNGDRIYLLVNDGPLRWVLTLFSCTENACPDVQFTAVFSGPNATPDIVARWNGDRRFVKAFHAAPETEGGDPQAVAQYDVLLYPGAGAQQMDDPIQVWRSLAMDLGRTVTAPEGATATPPAQ